MICFIYAYYLQHLNFVGHTSSEGVFYLEDGTEIGHAHNMFLQMAYDYGIIVGIIFLSIYMVLFVHYGIRGKKICKWGVSFGNIVFWTFGNGYHSRTDNGFADWNFTIFCERK